MFDADMLASTCLGGVTVPLHKLDKAALAEALRGHLGRLSPRRR